MMFIKVDQENDVSLALTGPIQLLTFDIVLLKPLKLLHFKDHLCNLYMVEKVR